MNHRQRIIPDYSFARFDDPDRLEGASRMDVLCAVVFGILVGLAIYGAIHTP